MPTGLAFFTGNDNFSKRILFHFLFLVSEKSIYIGVFSDIAVSYRKLLYVLSTICLHLSAFLFF